MLAALEGLIGVVYVATVATLVSAFDTEKRTRIDPLEAF